MFDTSRLTIAEQEVLAEALDARIKFLEKSIEFEVVVNGFEPSWRLWQARELRDALR